MDDVEEASYHQRPVAGRGELSTADERARVVRAREGDQGALAQLFRDHYVRVYNLVTYLTGDRTEADDVTQSTFVRAWEELPRLRDPQAFTAWLNRIARNLAADRARANRARVRAEEARPESLDPGDPVGPGPEQHVAAWERDEQVHEAVASLPEPHQEVVVMHHLEGTPVQEVAERLRIPVGTVLSRLARARAALRRKLAPYVDGDAA